MPCATGLGKSTNEEKGFFYWWFLDRKTKPPSEPPAGTGEFQVHQLLSGCTTCSRAE